MYVGGYAVECVLKAKLMKMFGCRTLMALEKELVTRHILGTDETIFHHRLSRLLRLTGATDRLRQGRQIWGKFLVVNEWVPAWRYNSDASNRDDARDFIDAVRTVKRWIEGNV
jgi:hypothetical protein